MHPHTFLTLLAALSCLPCASSRKRRAIEAHILPGLYGASLVSDSTLKAPLLLPLDAALSMPLDRRSGVLPITRTSSDTAVQVALPGNCHRVGWFGDIGTLHGALHTPTPLKLRDPPGEDVPASSMAAREVHARESARLAAASAMVTGTILASGSSIPAAVGCRVVFTPEPGFTGEAAFWFSTRDASGAEGEVVEAGEDAMTLTVSGVHLGLIIVAEAQGDVAPAGDAYDSHSDDYTYMPVLWNDAAAGITAWMNSNAACARSTPFLASPRAVATSPAWLHILCVYDSPVTQQDISVSVGEAANSFSCDALPESTPPAPYTRCGTAVPTDTLYAHAYVEDDAPHLPARVDVRVRVRGRGADTIHTLHRVPINSTIFLRHVGARFVEATAGSGPAFEQNAGIFVRYANESMRRCDPLAIASASEPLHGSIQIMRAPVLTDACVCVPGAASVSERVLRRVYARAAAEGRSEPYTPAHTCADIDHACAGTWITGTHSPSSVFTSQWDRHAEVIMYTPHPGFEGQDYFTYTPAHSRASARVNVSVTRGHAVSHVRTRTDAGVCTSPHICLIQQFDGRFNSLCEPQAGSIHTPLRRIAGHAYADRIDVPAGPLRPSTRAISNAVFAQARPVPSARGLSHLAAHFGQFLTHDLDFSTPLADFAAEGNFPIAIPTCDSTFDRFCEGNHTMRFRRTAPRVGTGAGTRLPREQLNKITAWLDLNVIYGTLTTRVAALRSATGGKLQHMHTVAGEESLATHTSTSSADLAIEERILAHASAQEWTCVPGANSTCRPTRGYMREHLALNSAGVPNLNLLGRPFQSLFVSGDNRANVQPGLIAMHTLLAREHNTVCEELQALLLARTFGIDAGALVGPTQSHGAMDAPKDGKRYMATASRARSNAGDVADLPTCSSPAAPAAATQSQDGSEEPPHACERDPVACRSYIWHALHPHAASYHIPSIRTPRTPVLLHLPGITMRIGENAATPGDGVYPIPWPFPFDGTQDAVRQYDEALFQTARIITRAKWQAVVWFEYLPLLLGPVEFAKVPPYRGYRGAGAIDPSISNEFASAAFRFGHSQVGPAMPRYDAITACAARVGALSLRDAYFTPSRLMLEGGVDPLMAGSLLAVAEEVDTLAVDEIRNALFGTQTQGFDLIALNVQRGRDHGLPDHNSVRVALGLPPHATWEDLTGGNAALAAALQEVYHGNISDVDLLVGGLAEKHVEGGNIGETFAALIRDVFTRVRDADRFWFEAAYMYPSTACVDGRARSGAAVEGDEATCSGGSAIDPCVEMPGAAVLRAYAPLEQLRATRIADLLARNSEVLDGALGREIAYSAAVTDTSTFVPPSEDDDHASVGVDAAGQVLPPRIPAVFAPPSRARVPRDRIPPALTESLFVARDVVVPMAHALCEAWEADVQQPQ